MDIKDFTRAERKIAISILEDAKRHLYTGADRPKRSTSTYVCFAVSSSSIAHSHYWVAYKIKTMLASRIHPYNTVIKWLRHQLPKSEHRKLNYTYSQQYRHAWVDSMIAEFKDSLKRKG